jgi:hypothetical protein
MIGPADYTILLPPQDATLSANSIALDRGVVMPNINDHYTGAAPDLGALELGCPSPVYGPRPDGMDETSEPYGCTASDGPMAQSVVASGGTPQTVVAGSPFLPLQARVLDSSSSPVAGVAVTFSAPTAGATGTFAAGSSVVVTTDSQGMATAPQFTANGIAGSYPVTASVAGVSAPAVFTLTNLVLPAVTVAAPASIVYSPSVQNILVSATVMNGAAPAATGTVSFSANGSQFTNVAVSNGAASTGFQVPAESPAGTQFTFTARYSAGQLSGGPSLPATTTVTKASPVVVWAAPSPIIAGTALSATQLNASANIPGAFAYTPPAGTVLAQGAGQKLAVAFTPKDSADYNAGAASVTIDVGAPSFAVAVAAPTSIVYSPAAQSIQVSATVINGATPAATGTVSLSANGSQFANVAVSNAAAVATFQVPAGTPAGTRFTFTAQYSGGQVSGPATTTVTKASPVIVWAVPGAIAGGTALSATQLNASANIPGTFVYTPPAGTVLPQGLGQKLSATLTPKDSANYTAGSASVTIDVGAPNFAMTSTLARDASGNVSATVTLTNTGGVTATGVAITAAFLNRLRDSVATAPVTLASGASATFTLPFIGYAGVRGASAALVVDGKYDGGVFALGKQVTLP